MRQSTYSFKTSRYFFDEKPGYQRLKRYLTKLLEKSIHPLMLYNAD